MSSGSITGFGALDAVYSDLFDAGVITEYDVKESRADDRGEEAKSSETGGLLRGGSGDDHLIGTDGQSDRFFIDGRDRGNDEGQHVDVITNFEIGRDSLAFRLDGGYFRGPGDDGSFVQGDRGDKMEQSRNGNQAEFSTASDLADLLLHVNTRGTVDAELKATGVTKSLRIGESGGTFDADGNFIAAEDVENTVNSGNKTRAVVETTDNSYVKVIGEHIVINIDDFKHTETHVDHRGNLKTTDKLIVLEDFEEELAAGFAAELGYNEFASRADSVHILGQDGDFSMGGGKGDNLFIMSAQQDTVQIDDRNTGDDENGHINILHGFDLTEDRISGRFDGKFFDGKNQAQFEGAAGIVELLTFAENVFESDGNLNFDLQSVGGGGKRDPLTFVLTDTTLDEVYTTAQADVFAQLVAAGVVPEGTVPPAPGGNGDSIITNGNGNKGDDIFIGSSGAETFGFDSRDGAEDGTRGTDDKLAHVDVVIGFNSDDSLFFRIDGGFFNGNATTDAFELKSNNNQATVGHDEVAELGAYLNALGEGTNSASYDSETNSTVLVIDDSPSNPEDDLTIVLWNSGDLL